MSTSNTPKHRLLNHRILTSWDLSVISIHPAGAFTQYLAASKWAMCLSSDMRESRRAFIRLSRSHREVWYCKWCCRCFVFDHDLGTGRKNLTEAPMDGKTKRSCFASAETSCLYWLYRSILVRRRSPVSLNFSLGMRKYHLSFWVVLTWVWGVILSMYLRSFRGIFEAN